MNTKKKIAFGTALLCIAVTLQMFTNCGMAKPAGSGGDEKASSGGSFTTSSANVQQGNQSGLIQIVGQCASGGGLVNISGATVAAAQAQCNNGIFQICTVLSGLGNNAISVSQGSSSLPLTVYTQYPVLTNPGLQFTTVVVNGPTSATVTISCTPGSALSSTIYGNEQLTGGATCTANGTFTFNVGLVANLVGTGQRVVYVTQITQSGTVTTIFVDVDNVVNAHTCSISYGQDAESLCAGQAGTVSGSCKGGSPVQIKVNDVVQQTVPCKENNTYTANNVILSKPGSNKVGIYQKSAFNTVCTAEKNATAFGQLQ